MVASLRLGETMRRHLSADIGADDGAIHPQGV
jgi:hypothetical protein